MLLLTADLCVTWCEHTLAERLGNIRSGTSLDQHDHPLAQEIQALLSATPADVPSPDKPLIKEADCEPVRIIAARTAAGPESGYAVSLLPLLGWDMPAELQPLLDKSSEMMCVLAPDFRILVANKAFIDTMQTRLGLTIRVGDSLRESCHRLPQDLKQALLEHSRQVYALSQNECTLALQDLAGEDWFGQVHSQLLEDNSGEVIGAAHVIEDMTRDLAQRQNLQETIAHFREAQSRQELFMRTLAHDVRSPLATLHMLLLQAHKEKIMPASRYFQILEENIHQLEDLVNGLLELIELQKDRHLQAQNVSFEGLLQKVKRQLAPQLHESGGRVEADFAVEAIAYAPSWIESILRNLIGNALKYSRPGVTPVVNVSTRTDAEGQIHLQVADNGRGFADGAVPPDLFQPFSRYHPDQPGSGLGLYLVRSMVEKNGGSVKAETLENQGTQFKLTLVPFEPD